MASTLTVFGSNEVVEDRDILVMDIILVHCKAAPSCKEGMIWWG
jgi:hypothetical protein